MTPMQKPTQIPIQDTYPAEFARCFGCGRLNVHGHRIKTFKSGGLAVTEHEPEPMYTGAADFAYGGLIASLIDCHSAGCAAIFWMEHEGLTMGEAPTPRFVTARLEVDYIAPTPLTTMRITGRPEEVAQHKVIVTSELSAGGEVTATGRAVMVKI
jgi:acyl-coenzyme A thioesterase PaaI-like protein